MVKAIIIKHCSQCPYAELNIEQEEVKREQITEHLSKVTTKPVVKYYCKENGCEECGEIPSWCPLTDYK